MRKLAVLGSIFLVVMALGAQTGPSQITLSPLGPVASCVGAANGDVLCAASDGFYISIAGGTFAKVNTGTPAPPVFTSILCPTATFSTGSTGTFTATGCTIK